MKRYLLFHTVLDIKLKFRNIHRKTSVLVPLFIKVVGLEACNFIKRSYQHSCLPVNIAKLKKKQLFRKPPVAAFMSTRKGKEEKNVEQKEKKFCK